MAGIGVPALQFRILSNTTTHTIHFETAANMAAVPDASVALIVTSPPYPMIEMWDAQFTAQNPEIGDAMQSGKANSAFELMHRLLDPVWEECFRILMPGGLACINIGDAVRTINKNFALFSNHTRILTRCLEIGFQALPAIIWRKQTNAPNKFMGSGMLPAGAYVTLEHEFILVLRKGAKREFKTGEDKQNRRRSAIFWEERNEWFSDVWFDLKGVRQDMPAEVQRRSGAFPFELAYRLINMFSVCGDTVLDPFLGTGNTMLAAMASQRHSTGYEIEPDFKEIIDLETGKIVALANQRIRERIRKHRDFVQTREQNNKPLKNFNDHYGFPCISKQESEIAISKLKSVESTGDNQYQVAYSS